MDFNNYNYYLLYGAIGGYLLPAVYAIRKTGFTSYSNLMLDSWNSRPMIESAVAGLAGNAIWVYFIPAADINSFWKGIGVGILGAFIYDRFLRPMLVQSNILNPYGVTASTVE